MLVDMPYDVFDQVPFTRFPGLEDSKLYFINTMAEWKVFFKMLMRRKLVACDTETSGFDYFAEDKIVGMSFGWNDIHFYIPVRHVDSIVGGAQPPQLSLDDLKEDLRTFFAQTDVYTIWHNFIFDRHFFKTDGIDIKTPFHDTMHLWQLYDENAPKALKTIASGWTDMMGVRHPGLVGPLANAKEKELSQWRVSEASARRKVFKQRVKDRATELRSQLEHQDKTLTVLKKWVTENEFQDHPDKSIKKDDIHYGFVPAGLMTEYAATDTYLTYKLYTFLKTNFPMVGDIQKVYDNELKLSTVLFHSEEHGVRIDRPYLEQCDQLLEAEIEKQTQLLTQELGNLNLRSTDQLIASLLGRGVKLTKMSKSGKKYSLDAKVLEKLSKDYPEAKSIIDLRAIEKIQNTYVRGILNRLTPEDILHCSFNQNVTTGRMSSRNPNLQNIPGRDDSIRKSFIPWSDDYVYVFADYSQVEVRITAHYSEDPLLLDSYAKGQDTHTRTMCEVFGYDYDYAVNILDSDDPSNPEFKPLKLLRNISKRVVFGIIYGVGAPGLSEQISPRPEQYAHLNKDQWEAVCQDYIDQYLDRYRGVKRFINRTKREVRKSGVVYNHFGRPRRLPHALNKDWSKKWLVGRAERQATNYMIQGTAADVFKTAVVRVHDLLEGTQSHMVNYVHDEIQTYIHKSELHLLNEMKMAMEDFDFIVPLDVDFSWSTKNWAEKREIG